MLYEFFFFLFYLLSGTFCKVSNELENKICKVKIVASCNGKNCLCSTDTEKMEYSMFDCLKKAKISHGLSCMCTKW